MSFAGAVRLAIDGRPAPAAPPRDDEVPPEVFPGAWAAWAAASPPDPAPAPALGALCFGRDGREGRLVEIEEGPRSFTVCVPM